MNRAPSYRGQPLVALIVILGGWVAVRTIIWEAWQPEIASPSRPRPQVAVGAQHHDAAARAIRPTTAPRHDAPAPAVWPMTPPVNSHSDQTYRRLPSEFVPQRPAPYAALKPLPPSRPAVSAAPALPPPARPRDAKPRPVPVQISAAHQLLWMGALARLPLPASLLAQGAPTAVMPAAAHPSPFRDARWSADGWLLLREGGAASTAGGFAPSTYGASQAGAVVRYRLAPESRNRPTLYLRGSAALNGSREREAAVGLSARPIAGVPLVAAAEARVNRQPGGTRVRPAAFVYTDLPPFELPLGTRGEAYGQAGYVGGNFKTAFADGQLRVDGRLLRLGRGELRAGGGAWGGAQKGASRFDIGPTATLGVPMGGTAAAQIGVDWRFRVAGNAAPASGPALTLSAGF